MGQQGSGAEDGGARLLDLGAVLLTAGKTRGLALLGALLLGVVAVGAGLLAPAVASATSRPAAEQEKIDWLLAQMKKSDAVFIRNGSAYTGEKAASHISTKLWWAGKRVQTARDFIQGVASHSEESGKPYEIRPKGAAASKPLGEWLLKRLDEHEKALASKKR